MPVLNVSFTSTLSAAAQIAREVEKAEKTRLKECLSLTEASTSVCYHFIELLVNLTITFLN